MTVSLFSQMGRYALRTVVVLAEADRVMTGKALAAETGVPEAYQSKVLRRLVEAEILCSQKGHHGGFTLARSPESTCLADILDAVGALPDEGLCVFGWGQCSKSEPCPLHHNWNELSEEVMAWAKRSTLAKLGGRS